jgi:hypothetical protein
MGYLLIKIHSFECDRLGCSTQKDHSKPSKREIVKIMRREGWYITADRVYCPQHWPRDES